jgi:hypothetical protein
MRKRYRTKPKADLFVPAIIITAAIGYGLGSAPAIQLHVRILIAAILNLYAPQIIPVWA